MIVQIIYLLIENLNKVFGVCKIGFYKRTEEWYIHSVKILQT
jgi:hypothetical protein